MCKGTHFFFDRKRIEDATFIHTSCKKVPKLSLFEFVVYGENSPSKLAFIRKIQHKEQHKEKEKCENAHDIFFCSTLLFCMQINPLFECHTIKSFLTILVI